MQMTYGFMGIARTGSVYMTMAITLERYFAIVRPLSTFNCKKALGPLTLAFAIAWNIPRFLEWKIMVLNQDGNWTEVHVSSGNWTQFEIHESSFRTGHIYNLYYRIWLTFLVIEAIPYLTIILLNGAILKKIVMSYTFRRSFTARCKSNNRRQEVVGNWLGNVTDGIEAHQMDTFRHGTQVERRSHSIKGKIKENIVNILWRLFFSFKFIFLSKFATYD